MMARVWTKRHLFPQCGSGVATLVNPREANDLGRFGLGLKTASLSQCRRLTVAALKDGYLSIAQWDMDECDRRRAWWLDRPPPTELPLEAISILEKQGHGTAVIWEDLDRLEAAGADQSVLDAADHLSLVFTVSWPGK